MIKKYDIMSNKLINFCYGKDITRTSLDNLNHFNLDASMEGSRTLEICQKRALGLVFYADFI